MVYQQEIAALERQRQLLVAQSEIHRVILALRWKRVETQSRQSLHLLAWVRKSYRVLLPGVFLAGVVLTRKKFPFRKVFMKLLVGWTLLRRALPLWRLFRVFTAHR